MKASFEEYCIYFRDYNIIKGKSFKVDENKGQNFYPYCPKSFLFEFLNSNSLTEARSVGLLPELLCAESRSLGFSKKDKKVKLFLLVAIYTQCAKLTSAFASSGFAVTTSRENRKQSYSTFTELIRDILLREKILKKYPPKEEKKLLDISLLR